MDVMTSIGEAVRMRAGCIIIADSKGYTCFAAAFVHVLLMRMTHRLKMLEVGEMVSACDLQLVDSRFLNLESCAIASGFDPITHQMKFRLPDVGCCNARKMNMHRMKTSQFKV